MKSTLSLLLLLVANHVLADVPQQLRVKFWAGNGVNFTNMVEPSRSMEIQVSGSASQSGVKSGKIEVLLPKHVTFTSARIADAFDGDADDIIVSNSGRNVTFELSPREDVRLNSSGFTFWIIVRTAGLDDLPVAAPTWEVQASTDFQLASKRETFEASETGFWLYTRPQVTLISAPDEVGSKARLKYNVVVPAYPHGDAVSGSFSIQHPFGTDLIEESIVGDVGNRLFPNSISYKWKLAPPPFIDITYEVEVWEDFELAYPDESEFVTKVTHTLSVETDYSNRNNADRTMHKRTHIGMDSTTVPLGVMTSNELIVNSTEDRPLKAGTTGCDTGEKLPNGEIECTLRAAIEAVNKGNTHPIHFDIDRPEVPVIFIKSALPAIKYPVVIDGSTQKQGRVLIRGNKLESVGLDVRGGESELRNLVIHGFTSKSGVCIRLAEKGENKVLGCYLGTDVSGLLVQEAHISVKIENCAGNQIGGAGDGEANILTGLSAGVQITGKDADRNRVIGNRVGLGSNGRPLSPRPGVGILVRAGTNNVIGGSGKLGNLVAAKDFGIAVIPDSPIKDTQIVGNRVGLDEAGKNSAGTFAGIVVLGFDDGTVSDTRVFGNDVAGGFVGIWTGIRGGLKGIDIENNTVGLAFDGSGALPQGLKENDHQYGIRLDGGRDVMIKDNTVAGHVWNVMVAGYPHASSTEVIDEDGDGVPESGGGIILNSPDQSHDADEVSTTYNFVVESNVIGLNKAKSVPTGAKQAQGLTIFGIANGTKVLTNTIAGHKAGEVWLRDGIKHVVSGNMIGTHDGTGHGSKVGIWIEDAADTVIGPSNIIGRCEVVGIQVIGDAEQISITSNTIGADPFGLTPWPNGAGILLSNDEFSSPDEIKIERNLISGNTNAGINMKFSDRVEMNYNRIGVTAGGGPLSNQIGIRILGGSADLVGNTVANNKASGIAINSTEAVEIKGGPIYKNGSGEGLLGILYKEPPHPAPKQVVALRTAPDEFGRVTVVIAAPASGSPFDPESPLPGLNKDPILEVYGNRPGNEMQGRVPLLRESVKAKKPFLKKLVVPADSPWATLDNFTATLTKDGKTSEFSTHAMAEAFVWPELNFGPSDSDKIALWWPESNRFRLEGASDIIPTWTPINSAKKNGQGFMEVTLPIRDELGSQIFRLAIDPNKLFLK